MNNNKVKMSRIKSGFLRWSRLHLELMEPKFAIVFLKLLWLYLNLSTSPQYLYINLCDLIVYQFGSRLRKCRDRNRLLIFKLRMASFFNDASHWNSFQMWSWRLLWGQKSTQDRDKSSVKERSQVINLSKLMHGHFSEESGMKPTRRRNLRERKLHAV